MQQTSPCEKKLQPTKSKSFRWLYTILIIGITGSGWWRENREREKEEDAAFLFRFWGWTTCWSFSLWPWTWNGCEVTWQSEPCWICHSEVNSPGGSGSFYRQMVSSQISNNCSAREHVLFFFSFRERRSLEYQDSTRAKFWGIIFVI